MEKTPKTNSNAAAFVLGLMFGASGLPKLLIHALYIVLIIVAFFLGKHI